LARETEAGGHAGHGQRNQMVQISVAGVRHLQGPETDIIQRLVVDAVRLVCVFHQLMDRQGGVVGFHHRVGHFGRRHHRVGVHYAIWVLLADLRDQQGAHSGASSAAQRVRQLEALKKVDI